MTPDISIITFTLGGRPKYLIGCLDSVFTDVVTDVYNEIKVEHHLVFQGENGISEVESFLNYFNQIESYKLIIHKWPQNIGIGAGLNKIIPQCNGNLIFKMDDDCKVVSGDFFEKVMALHTRFPNSVFSPFPVGLINSLGGVRGAAHRLWHDKNTDTIWTKRIVNHVGGFARIAPKSIYENFSFENDLISGISGNEDGQFSSYCNLKGIEMFYLEDGLVVSHQESTLGQALRYPEYFSTRNYEGNLTLIVED